MNASMYYTYNYLNNNSGSPKSLDDATYVFEK